MAVGLTGVSVVLTSFLVPFTINTLLFIWFLTQMNGTGSTDESIPLFFGQLIFVVVVAVGTFFAVRSVTKQLYKVREKFFNKNDILCCAFCLFIHRASALSPFSQLWFFYAFACTLARFMSAFRPSAAASLLRTSCWPLSFC